MKKIFTVLKFIGYICMVYLVVTGMWHANVAGQLYDKPEITKAEIESKSEYKTITTIGSSDSDDFYYKIRKLSGVERVCQINLDDDEGVTITCTPGDAKILILDEQGQQMFYAPVTELHLQPDTAGKYDIYIIGKRFTGEVVIEYQI